LFIKYANQGMYRPKSDETFLVEESMNLAECTKIFKDF